MQPVGRPAVATEDRVIIERICGREIAAFGYQW